MKTIKYLVRVIYLHRRDTVFVIKLLREREDSIYTITHTSAADWISFVEQVSTWKRDLVDRLGFPEGEVDQLGYDLETIRRITNSSRIGTKVFLETTIYKEEADDN